MRSMLSAQHTRHDGYICPGRKLAPNLGKGVYGIPYSEWLHSRYRVASTRASDASTLPQGGFYDILPNRSVPHGMAGKHWVLDAATLPLHLRVLASTVCSTPPVEYLTMHTLKEANLTAPSIMSHKP